MAHGNVRITVEQTLATLRRKNIIPRETAKLLRGMLKEQPELADDLHHANGMQPAQSEVQALAGM